MLVDKGVFEILVVVFDMVFMDVLFILMIMFDSGVIVVVIFIDVEFVILIGLDVVICFGDNV